MADRWDPKDPIVGAGSIPGTHKTQSGRYVNESGFYVTPAEARANKAMEAAGRDPNSRAVGTRPRDAGSGRGELSVAERSKIWNMSPRARQAYLRSMGYSVKVDGQSGPQTASAAWSYVHGHDASFFNSKGRDWQQSVWNQHFAKYHKPAPGDPPTTGDSSPKAQHPNNRDPQSAGDTPFGADSPYSPGLAADLAYGVRTLYGLAKGGAKIDPNLADSMGTMLDAKGLGAAAAEAQYGANLRAQLAEVNRLPGQAKQNQADLTSWYGKVGDRQRLSAAADAAMANSLITDSQGASAGVINALGGGANPSAGDLGQAGENETATLRALKLAGATGSSEIAAAIGAEGLSARTRQRNIDQQALVDAQNRLYDTQQASGAARTKAEQDAIDRNNALAQARLQARTGIIGQNNALLDARAQRVAAALSAEEGAASLGPDLAYKGALAKAAVARAMTPASPSKQPKGAWVNLNGAQRRQLTADATGLVQAGVERGDTTPNIVSRVVNSYRAQGLHPANNPEVAQAIVGVLQANGIKVRGDWAIAKWAGLK